MQTAKGGGSARGFRKAVACTHLVAVKSPTKKANTGAYTLDTLGRLVGATLAAHDKHNLTCGSRCTGGDCHWTFDAGPDEKTSRDCCWTAQTHSAISLRPCMHYTRTPSTHGPQGNAICSSQQASDPGDPIFHTGVCRDPANWHTAAGNLWLTSGQGPVAEQSRRVSVSWMT